MAKISLSFRTMLVNFVYLPLIRLLSHPVVKELGRAWLNLELRKLLTA